jgi:iron(III) transport system substrate-binding protein
MKTRFRRLVELNSTEQRVASWVKFTLVGLASAVAGCGSPDGPEVIVYAALDEPFSRPVFDRFTEQTGIEVRAKFDSESTKTVGLTSAIIAERARPRCDLFWNNEILNTIRLQQKGILRSYHSPAAAAYPESAKSSDGAWYGFAARARVLIVNTNRVQEENHPKSIVDLTDPQWRGQVGVAKPLFGTTASHAACLFTAWGDEEAKRFFRNLRQNAKIMSGNRQVARAVGSGAIAFGLTDTDDAIVELERGLPVAIIYPDQREGELGTLFIPNTLALVKDSPNPGTAEILINYLLSAEVERSLAEGASAQIPLNPEVDQATRVETPQTIRAMKVDFERAATNWDRARAFLVEQFTPAD